ncbi:MAG: hypothetical protein IJW40_08785 [Clostridia bacterium]|nr:hypothetical protein [Clostridia bacterium]
MNKRFYLRAMAWLMTALMLLGSIALTSCADDEPQDPDTPEDPGTSDGSDEAGEDTRIPLDYLPQATYGGLEINVLEWSVSGQRPGQSWVPWEDIDVDSGDGDPISNAIYDRNGVVEETYDVVITKEYIDVNDDLLTTAVRNNEATGDLAYQMITTRTFGIKALCMEGLMANMFEMENLHTDMPWWNQDSVRSYTVGNALYFAAPEMLLRDKGATAAMFYNQKVASDEGIEDLYALVESGDWTMEAMIGHSQDVSADMDGDDLISSGEDMYGLYGGTGDLPFFLYTGAAQKFAEVDEYGYLRLTFGDDEDITIWQDILDMVMYTDFYYFNKVDTTLLPTDYNVFTSDHTLFYAHMVKEVLNLRNMESDYGVLPVPKYDEYQDDYSSLVWMHHDCVLGIPASCTTNQTTVDAVSAVLEHMSYISYYDVYPIFYDTIILGKSARDEQSKEMLELIFRTRSFDPGQYWIPKETEHFLFIYSNGHKNVSSVWASVETAFTTGVEAYNNLVDELN